MVAPILNDLLNTITAIFSGTVKFSILVLGVLFALRFIVDALLPKKLESLMNIVFFPGSFMHQAIQSLAIRMLGYEVRVNFHMAFDRDYASQSIKGDLKKVGHAVIIGLSPMINLSVVITLIIFGRDIKALSIMYGAPMINYLRIYFLIAFLFFAIPDTQDLMLPFYAITSGYSEIAVLLVIGLIFFVFGVNIWGWLIPSINLFLYCVVLVYLIQKEFFAPPTKNYYKLNDADSVNEKEGEELLLFEV